MNTANNTANENERSDIEDLLPWHAAGTLGHRDAERVEAALAGDPELARRYELVREELGETIHLNETLGAPSARAAQMLFAGIDAEPARRPAASVNLAARMAEFFGGLRPRTLAWSAAAAGVAILLQAAVIAGIVIKDKAPGAFETASVPSQTTGAGSYVLIRFQPQATAAEIASFLESNKLSIAGGPAAGGLFRVQVAATKLAKPELANVVRTLRSDKVVGFIVVSE